MKFTVFALSLAGLISATSAAESSTNAVQAEALDIGSLLGGLKPLLKKGHCVAPCMARSANALDCEDDGPFSTICHNIDQIHKETLPCAKKCGVDKSLASTVYKIYKDLCKSAMKGSSRE
ncbi:hypothetical protein GQ602_002435 [Ophiocordyceps camponoti-floridani]|uniref:Extracellular membrane protein CFEM domain-containing protein n=1 Tax=Ophiocordyceps camponoti-floridani TaxID=2030778 RepID=A0A8H4VFD2_9HYPO|nr:hypothetical protein GQ602_002435 [Ophiocordyceps camponoti-floridani]